MSLVQEPPELSEPPRPRAGAWLAKIDALDDAVNELLAADTITAVPGELGQCLVRLQAIKARLCAAETAALATFDLRQEWRRDGSRSAAGWLAARCKTPRKVLNGLVRLARRLRVAHKTRAALALGVIDQSRAEELTRLADSSRKPIREAFAAEEADLVGLACDLEEDELTQALGYWRDRVDPDGTEDQAAKDHDDRHVHLSQSGWGRWFLEGELDPIGGAEVAEALRRIDEELFKVDWDRSKAEHGDETRSEHLERTPTQRRADALVEMARRAMATPEGARLPRPLVSVLVGYETFAGPVRQMFNGTVLSPGQIAGLVTLADIERVVFGPTSRDITDLGRRSRFFTDAQRRALEVRDQVCFHSTCNRSAEQCEMDHRVPWSADGETNLDNGRPACRKHNNDRNGHDRDGPDP